MPGPGLTSRGLGARGPMIFAGLGLVGVGLWFLIAGDAPARVLGVLLVTGGLVLGYLFWVAVAVERPDPGGTRPAASEVRNG